MRMALDASSGKNVANSCIPAEGSAFINPRRACAARVTVVVRVCVSVTGHKVKSSVGHKVKNLRVRAHAHDYKSN